jgi:UDP-glucose 4-epimerase
VSFASIKSAKYGIRGTYNLANGEGVRLEDIARAFSVQRGVKLVYEPHRVGDAKYVVLNVDKARAAWLIPQEPPVNDYRS